MRIYFAQQISGPGAVRKTLEDTLSKYAQMFNEYTSKRRLY
ncbi:hypothetical protein HMPREF9104_00224 [Lentilactobacillus kisonensis F0435]|uniref:Uncharacterized protein n=1 Tax=Lentilactobacillus kisonensis F0435 TaxID=797516 RepID=H1LCB1_9LACO|nr:hypothetical protein HMPREF9104_00224 [Lentilactobacillus kisonensis F0435]